MIAFFDTNVHVDILTGALAPDVALDRVAGGPVRLSPIVASELLRGARGNALREIEKLAARLVPIEPPSWAKAWLEAGRLLPRLFRDHEAIGLGRLQNDVLLALTARHTGAMVVTRDRHFQRIAAAVPFRCAFL